MKRTAGIFVAILFLASCTGVAPFSSKKHANLKWIKHDGAQTTQKDEVVVQPEEKKSSGNQTEFMHTASPDVITETNETGNQKITKEVSMAEHTVQPVEKKAARLATEPVAGKSDVNDAGTQRKQEKKQVYRKAKPALDDDVRSILAIIFAIFLPPLGVYLTRETGNPFVLTLVLCLLALVGIFFIYAGILWLVAMIIALLAVLQDV